MGLISFLTLLPQRQVIRMRLLSENCVEWAALRISLSWPQGSPKPLKSHSMEWTAD